MQEAGPEGLMEEAEEAELEGPAVETEGLVEEVGLEGPGVEAEGLVEEAGLEVPAVETEGLLEKVGLESPAVEAEGLVEEAGEICFPVAQLVEHGVSNAKIMGSIPRESKS